MQLAEAQLRDGTGRAKSRVGRRALWGYGLLTLALLLPGIVLAALGPIVDETAVSPLHLAAKRALEPIAFMSGLRFWLGVAGTTMVAVLLLYPLRKRFGTAPLAGSVGGWFHVHLALGLIGPALVLYHTNFGFGSFNANVALWSVGIVVASGLVALTIYLSASERMARTKVAAADSLDDILRLLRPPGYHDLGGTRLAEDIRTLHHSIAEQKGVFLAANLRREKTLLVDDAARYVRDLSARAGAAPREADELAASFRARLLASLSSARAAARSTAIERGMRLWRLLHLPVIAVGVISTTLHVHAVWGVVDDPPPSSRPAPTLVAPPAPLAKPGASIEIAGVRRTPFAATRTSAAPRAASSRTSSEAASAVDTREPELKQGPAPASRTRAPDDTTAPLPPPTPTSFNPPPRPKPAVTPQPVASAAAKPFDDGSAAVAELKRRNDAAPRRIGELGGLTLAARIAELKSGAFDHARTNFALTGKHKRVACEDCHTKTLIDTPRDCIACHRQDDVHRGRRRECANCHTTNRWSEIVRRR